jgi:amidohydrolase
MTRIPRTLAVGLLSAFCPFSSPSAAQGLDPEALHREIDRRAAEVLPKVVSWRRDLHEHPELGNREVRTAGLVADQLRALGFEVRTGVAHTGVVGLLRGGRPGPVVALRSDMDALPVTEEVDLPFRSKVRTTYQGREVGVMHACGHDNHMAILLGTAEVLAGMRDLLPGSVKLIFQPAEEGPPAGETGGAALMVEEGVLENPKVDAIFGLHVFPFPVGHIAYRPGGIMAAADNLAITVRGSQTHGALPWAGVDPVVVSAQIVLGLQTIVSRQVDLTVAPAVVTIGSITGGNRGNIIPDEVTMAGTIRTFDPAVQTEIHRRIRLTAERIAESAGASAEVRIDGYGPVTFNDPGLTERMAPTLARVGGRGVDAAVRVTTTAEDFARYQQKVPGLFFFLGVTPEGVDPARAAPNHSPRFFADEGALIVGVRALSSLAVDYLLGNP